MRKICMLLIVAMLMVLSGSAWAFNYRTVYLDVGNDYNGDLDNTTGLFKGFGLELEASSTFASDISHITSLDPIAFVDQGDAYVSELGYPSSTGALTVIDDTENMRNVNGLNDWELTIDWSGLGGFAVPIADTASLTVFEAHYTPGTIFTMYFDTTPDADFGAIQDDPNDSIGFNDGDLAITVQVTGGVGSTTFYKNTGLFSRSSTVNYEVVAVGGFPGMAQDFFYLADGTDLYDLIGTPGVFAFASESSEPSNSRYDASTFTTYTQNDGTIGIPEPTCLLFLGCMLMMFGITTRRKIKG